MNDSAALPAESPDEHNEKNMRKVAGTALAGTSIEWYDFFIYGTAAALIFPTAFFPADMPATVALIASFSTFAVGFIARPLGGIIFGHYGDRVGRKQTLVVALLIMGGGTTLIGLLPLMRRSVYLRRYYSFYSGLFKVSPLVASGVEQCSLSQKAHLRTDVAIMVRLLRLVRLWE